jgi:ribosomal protein S18 acetylase RimI-like enzyme
MLVLDSCRVSDGETETTVTLERPDPTHRDVPRWLIEVDLQTFTENTWSEQTAQAVARFGAVFLLRAEGLVIGTCACVRSHSERDTVVLLSMGLMPGWRGRGLGQWMIGGVLRALARDGAAAVMLQTSSRSARARKVYEDVGFLVVEMGELEPDGERVLVLRAALSLAEASVA